MVSKKDPGFVLGLDLDGVCADFYGSIRPLAAEWLGKKEEELTEEVTYGLEEWGFTQDRYERFHRWAVTKRSLFENMAMIPGAGAALRSLDQHPAVRIRVITNRLIVKWFHHEAVRQTTAWLDHHDVPYWDLCFMGDKTAVNANLYVEDTPQKIANLRERDQEVIVFTNSTNRHIERGPRADDWGEAEELVRERLGN